MSIFIVVIWSHYDELFSLLSLSLLLLLLLVIIIIVIITVIIIIYRSIEK